MRLRLRTTLTGVAALTMGATLCGVVPSAGNAGASVNPSTATSAAAFGGMSGLIKAAKGRARST